jgi:amidohydrolase
MHACGHDGHVAILIGAARVLGRLRQKLPRPVKLIFQPAEEGLGGAKRMLDAGVLEEKIGGLKVAVIFGLHGWPTLPVGTVGTRVGPLLAGADRFEIAIHGKGGHGAMPNRAVDPIVAAAQVVTALQTVVSRNVDPTAQAVVTVGEFHAGTAINIIPQSAALAGTIRTLDDAVAEHIHRRLSAVAQHVSAGLGCSADVRIAREFPVTVNDPAATALLRRVARDVLGEQAVREQSVTMGSEDFSFLSAVVPGCYFFLGLRRTGQGEYPAVHSPQFDFNDEAILPGVRMMVALALASAEAPGV